MMWRLHGSESRGLDLPEMTGAAATCRISHPCSPCPLRVWFARPSTPHHGGRPTATAQMWSTPTFSNSPACGKELLSFAELASLVGQPCT